MLIYTIKDILKNKPSKVATNFYNYSFLNKKTDIDDLLPAPLRELKILVLGCGYAYQDVVLFSNYTKNVVGLDLVTAYYRDGIIRGWRASKNSGENLLYYLLKIMYFQYFYSRQYRQFTNLSGHPINHKEYILKSYDGNKMPFDDETFDIVISNAVLEHVENMDLLFQEVIRVTKHNGYSYHNWHNYYSFSGGHAPESLCLKHPWGHLRGLYETHGINKLTPDEIKSYFLRYFNILAFHQLDGYDHKKADGNFSFEREDFEVDPIVRTARGLN
jgi:SAM-dependent methyltransferase